MRTGSLRSKFVTDSLGWIYRVGIDVELERRVWSWSWSWHGYQYHVMEVTVPDAKWLSRVVTRQNCVHRSMPCN